jgi:ABC-type antimicrobial peptide transport system permease subunit
MTPERILAATIGVFGILATSLAAVGLYGVVAFLTLRRTREIGIRTALGAGRREILELVIGEGARLVGPGIVVGLCAAVAVTRLARSLLFGVDPLQPGSLVLAAAVMLAVGVIACAGPARRAARVDPLVALRYE